MSKISDKKQFTILVSNNVSVIEDGKAVTERTGSISNPFTDLRDALSRAQELASPYEDALVRELLTRGTHYILLEEESQFFTSL